MADLKFWNIGKANAEIVRLEAEVVKAQAETKAAKDNAAEVETAAEATSAELVTTKAELKTDKDQVAAKDLQIAAKDSEIATVKAELKTTQEKLANPSVQITQIASQKAAEITAAQGQPPVKVPTNTNPAAAGKEPNNLTGLAKVQAAFKAQLLKQQG
jgi:chromosome segregation ATPase